MKKKIFLGAAVIAVAAVSIVACKRSFDNKFDARATSASERIPSCEACDSIGTQTLSGVITSNTQLDCNIVYRIDGKVFVSNNATLTIPEGTVLKGVKYANPANASALVITKGAKLDARGSQTCPIIFTSDAANPQPGDWGGVVLLGAAPTNQPTTTIIEGINTPSVPVGVDISYGGNTANDNSGVLTYVRIEYAGASIAQDNELNGLTLGGVGSNTVLDFIEVYRGNDDAFEFFGGTVNAKHLIAFEPDDDAFDFDFGYTGSIQFAVSVLSNDTSRYSANPNGIESNNDAAGATSGGLPITPRTHPYISNMTVVGVNRADSATAKGLLNGALFRVNSGYTVYNSVFFGFPTGLRLQSTPSINDNAEIKYSVFHGYTDSHLPVPPAIPLATCTEFTGANPNSTILLDDPFNASDNDFRPVTGSPLIGTANFTGAPGAAVWTTTGITYRGAFASGTGSNWMYGWAKITTLNP
jgi:hypothetical protein